MRLFLTRALILVLGCLFLWPAAAPAQFALRGTIDGALTDASGAGVPGATVTLTETARNRHPALHALRRRQSLPVAAPDRHYAFLKVAADGGERVLVVLNFRPEEENVQVDLSGVDFGGMNDLATGAPIPTTSSWSLTMPPYGYRFFGLTERKGRVS